MPKQKKTGGWTPIEVSIGRTTPPLVTEVSTGTPVPAPKPKPTKPRDAATTTEKEH